MKQQAGMGRRLSPILELMLAVSMMIPTLGACASKEAKEDHSSPKGETAAASSAAGHEEEAVAPSAVATQPSLIFLGDSLTAGFGLAADEALPALIQERVDEAKLGYQVINAGRSGDTTAGGLARLGWYLRKETRPAGLVVFLGANDGMRGLSTEDMEENLRKIIAAARDYDADLPVFLVAVKAFPNMGEEFSQRFEAVYPTVAETEKVELLDFPLLNVAAKPELNQPDGIHPTAEGTIIVADQLWSQLGTKLPAVQP